MRKTLSRLALTGVVIASLGGCAGLNLDSDKRVELASNTFNEMQEGRVNTNEDKINFQKVGLLDNNYFVIPLNTSEKVLSYGEPSFALIPESEARITITDVGVKGGKVVVDAPEGGIYFPHAYDSKQNLSLSFATQKPVRFATNFKLSDLRKPDKKEGKISLERISERNLPFSDEALQVIGNQRYLVNRAGDINHSSILPIYFTRLPISVEYDRTKKDKGIRIIGNTYVFQKGYSLKGYFNQRGHANPIEGREKARKEIQTIRVDKKQ